MSWAGPKRSGSSRPSVPTDFDPVNKFPDAWKTLANVNVDDPENRKSTVGVPLLKMESMNVSTYENVYFGLNLYVSASGRSRRHLPQSLCLVAADSVECSRRADE